MMNKPTYEELEKALDAALATNKDIHSGKSAWQEVSYTQTLQAEESQVLIEDMMKVYEAEITGWKDFTDCQW